VGCSRPGVVEIGLIVAGLLVLGTHHAPRPSR
jgi:hypothetical protein